MKTFGQSVAIMTAGKDAVEDVEASLDLASERLTKYFHLQVEQLHVLGYRIDPDSYEPFQRETADAILVGYTVKAEQSIPLLRRIIQAVRRS